MHQVTIKIPDGAYNVARQAAESRGYLSVEEYVADWLEDEAAFETTMTPELARALEDGLSDSRSDRIINFDEHNRRHAEQRAQWIQAH